MKKKIKILRKYYLKLIKLIFEIIYGKIKFDEKLIVKLDQKLIKLKKDKVNDYEYYFYAIKKARLYTDAVQNVAVIKNNLIVDKVSFQLKDTVLLDAKNNGILETGVRKFLQKKIKGRVLSLLQGFSGAFNYSHWLCDILPKLIILNKFISIDSIDKILISNIDLDFQKQSLDLLNIRKDKIINGNKIRHIFADEFIFLEHPYWKNGMNFVQTINHLPYWAIKSVRDKFIDFADSKKKFPEKIFIDRSDSPYSRNQIINHDEVWSELQKAGFVKFRLAEMPFIEQITLFKNAKFIVGAHGAGLANIIFSSPGSKLLEFRSPNFDSSQWKIISEMNNMKFDYIMSKRIVNQGNGDIFVPTETMKKFL